MKVIYKIKRIREDKMVTLRMLSDMSGIGISTINEIENNKRHPTIPTLLRIAIALNVNIEELYDIQ